MQCFISIDGIPIFIHSYKSIMGNIIGNFLPWCKQVLAYMTQMSGEDRTGFGTKFWGNISYFCLVF